MSLISNIYPVMLTHYKTVEEKRLPLKELNPSLPLVHSGRSYIGTRDSNGILSNGYQEARADQLPYLDLDSYSYGVNDLLDGQLETLELDHGNKSYLNAQLYQGLYNYGSYDYWLYGKNLVHKIGHTALEEFSTYLGFPYYLGALNPVAKSPMNVCIWTRGKYNDPVPHRTATQVGLVIDEAIDYFSMTHNLLPNGRGGGSAMLDQYAYDPETNTLWFPRTEISGDTFMGDSQGYGMQEIFIHPDVQSTENLNLCGDVIGIGNGTDGQNFYTKFFPVDVTNEIKLYTYRTIDGTSDGLRLWTKVDSLNNVDPLSYVYTLDEDLGIVRFGGTLGLDSILIEDIDNSQTYIRVLDIERFPDSGFLHLTDRVNNELIKYSGKCNNTLGNVVRSDTPSSFDTGTEVRSTSSGHILESGQHVCMFYTASPRIDFEANLSSSLDNLAARPNQNISSYHLRANEGFLVLNRKNQKINSIVMKADQLKRIRLVDGSYAWGPVYSRETVSRLEGLVLDEKGLPIADIEVTVSVIGPGMLDYLKEIIVTTNSEGKFWVNYFPDPNALLTPIYSVKHTDDGNTSIIEFAGTDEVPSSVDDLRLISLYAVLKDDGAIGTVGKHYPTDIATWHLDPVVGSLIGSSVHGTPIPSARSILTGLNIGDGIVLIDPDNANNLMDYIDGEITYGYTPHSYDGTVQPISFTTLSIKDIWKEDHLVWGAVDIYNPRLYFNTWIIGVEEKLLVPPKSIVSVFLRKSIDTAWDPYKLNGMKSVLRVKSEETVLIENPPSFTPWVVGDDVIDQDSTSVWKHPNYSGEAYTYKPVTPLEQLGPRTFRFPKVPKPDAMDNYETLGAYAIYLPRISKVTAQAKKEDCPTVYAAKTEMKFLNSISPMDNGTVKDANGFYIPYGFRLIDDHAINSSTVDTVTYFTINDNYRLSSIEGFGGNTPLVSYIGPLGSIIYPGTLYNPQPLNVGLEINITE